MMILTSGYILFVVSCYCINEVLMLDKLIEFAIFLFLFSFETKSVVGIGLCAVLFFLSLIGILGGVVYKNYASIGFGIASVSILSATFVFRFYDEISCLWLFLLLTLSCTSIVLYRCSRRKWKRAQHEQIRKMEECAEKIMMRESEGV